MVLHRSEQADATDLRNVQFALHGLHSPRQRVHQSLAVREGSLIMKVMLATGDG